MDNATETSRDWIGSARANLLAWRLPHLAIVATLFLPVPTRTAVWTLALAWMGAACLLTPAAAGARTADTPGPTTSA